MGPLQKYTCTSGGFNAQRDPGESCRWTLQEDPVRAGCQRMRRNVPHQGGGDSGNALSTPYAPIPLDP
eukprot:4666124-Heterocapsa_arctica.AAC.1